MTMVKTDAEILKVVRALTIMMVQASTTFFGHLLAPKDWMEGHEASVKLIPSTSKDPTQLVEFRVEKKKDATFPQPNLTRKAMTPTRLYDLVGEVRKKFKSIHDTDSDCLKFKLDRIPTEDDIAWAEEVSRSYGVNPDEKRQKCILFKLDDRDEEDSGLADIGSDDKNFELVMNQFKDRFRISSTIPGIVERFKSDTPESQKKGSAEVKEY